MIGKIFLTGAFWALSLLAARGQGTVQLNTHIFGTVEAPISRPDGTGAGVGVTAQLIRVHEDGSLTPLFPTAPFRTNSPAAAYYVSGPDLVIAGTKGWDLEMHAGQIRVVPGDIVTLRLRAWEGFRYETATLRGESNDIIVRLGGGNAPPAVLRGLQRFVLKPQFAFAPPKLENQSLEFKVSVPKGQRVLFQVSNDLINWETTEIRMVSGGAVKLSEPQNQLGRYFRAISE